MAVPSSLCISVAEVDMVVLDMAGTTVNADEGGAVYRCLIGAMEENGVSVDRTEFEAWHGANKVEVIRHFTAAAKGGVKNVDESTIDMIFQRFLALIEEAYFAEDSDVQAMEGAVDCFQRLKEKGITVCLNTGYARSIAEKLVEKLGYATYVDGFVTAEDVGDGRPYPYMIFKLMKDFHKKDVRRVVKVGDTVRDIEEGANAGVGYVVGVTSGADSGEALQAAGATHVLSSVADILVA